MESKAWTEKLGVFQCFQKIHNMVQDKTGDNLMDDVIDNILRSGKIELPEPHASIVEKAICDYVEEVYSLYLNRIQVLTASKILLNL